MKQLAWLDFYRGKWHLVTSNPSDPARQWADDQSALTDLAGEGWTISGPHPERPDARAKAWGVFQGYALVRVIQ